MGFGPRRSSMTDAATPAPDAAGTSLLRAHWRPVITAGAFRTLSAAGFLPSYWRANRSWTIPGGLVGVGFQRALHGAQLDDIVAETSWGFLVEFSIKGGVAIRAGDHPVRETLTRAWASFQANGNAWSGLIAPPTATGIGDLALLVFLARQHADLDDFMRTTTTPDTVSDERRRRYAACRTILSGANGAPLTDPQYHAFLRRFLVPLDFAIPGHGALESIFTTLSVARGISRQQARALFDRLVAISEEAGIASTRLERPALLERLRHDGVAAGFAADLARDVTALDAYAQRTFESGGNTVAGVQLDRATSPSMRSSRRSKGARRRFLAARPGTEIGRSTRGVRAARRRRSGAESFGAPNCHRWIVGGARGRDRDSTRSRTAG